ncbi:radical SAM protein [Streptomyces sp. FH025]|uniref:radical SAM protein n=1 Tax=Streptomyces sp. FH025 TaxID=2815937 RepID=UPI001A9F2DD4|nr:radical SAM protein [Streptomyces sp. FH025]MBO1414671.1 radical SAM protein [Streptomyces sp. FH025]
MTQAAAPVLPGIQRVEKLYLELLFRCNFSCTTCYHGEDLKRPDTVTVDQATAALTYFADHYDTHWVCLLGGEPLLFEGLPAVLAAAKALGYRTEICTNGYKRRAFLTQAAEHLDMLRVSLDGGTAEAHDRIRRPGSFAAAFDTLAWAHGRTLPFGATCTLTGENITTIPALAKRLRDLGARDLMLHRVRLVGNAADSGITPVTWEQTQYLHEQLIGMDLGGMKVNTDILLPERCPPPSDVVEKLEISPDGRVYLSCAEVAGPGREVRYDFDQAALVTVDAA